VASIAEALEVPGGCPEVCVIGVATIGGVLPPEIREDLLAAARRGLTLVNGLHRPLADDREIADAVRKSGGRIVDLRRPRPVAELRFWTGEILRLETPRVAVLGTDCALGKRTTCSLLQEDLVRRGVHAEMVYTGQTGWLQGHRHGFILDATPNDFVCGELERAILECAAEEAPDLILLEGQSGLRNPAGPCGSELVLSGAAAGVVLLHAPGRQYFEGLEGAGCPIPPLAEELAMIRLLGSEVWGLALNSGGSTEAELRTEKLRLADELGIPVVLPLHDGVAELSAALCGKLNLEDSPS
jgi:uncharacterized NAD-dependent epimerase/dehydratase family protein